jgi:hypothetical protein
MIGRCFWLGATTVSLLAMACSSTDTTAAAGEDVSQTESDTEALSTANVGSDGSGNLAVATATATGGFFLPAGCLTEINDVATSTATFTYADCTGPYGLVHLTGTVTVAYSSTGANDLTLNLSATNFQINKATLTSFTATAAITATGATRDMTWNASMSGVTGRGRDFTRTTSKNLTWTVGGATECVAIDGTAEGTVTGAHLKTTITSYQRCKDACPQAGSEIQIDDVDNGNSVDIKYQGGPQASVTEDRKNRTETVTIELACGLL